MNNPLVIKVGGALLQQQTAMDALMTTIASLIKAGQPVVLVHGGGCLVDEQLTANNKQTVKRDGLRVTPADHINIVVGALAGTSNKLLQGAAIKSGLPAVGMCLSDGQSVTAKVKSPQLGLVGEVQANDAVYLNFMLKQQWLPVCSSIAIDDAGQAVNVNADQGAAALAQLLNGTLVLLSDVEGVLDASKTLIPSLNADQINQLVVEGVIEKGMKVKVEAALEVAQDSGIAVNIASWKDTHALLDFANGGNLGTQIQP
ncbi:acetylglutamate kinase [Shewanella intestini]|uniref:Acetylglutamate kinase n=1 Tax=Shewanella intestini TaxID=2017544 RepID=A0ABS5I4S4_9GAMM|nr:MULTISPECIES: acetylglutamate kinase [Shewanella]MBR9728699.1 acetylglutamate kinase [Shewanella intestini]MRG37622.1 acetylglutamate kinase [Shewanella sp. XMDDZSB0408]